MARKQVSWPASLLSPAKDNLQRRYVLHFFVTVPFTQSFVSCKICRHCMHHARQLSAVVDVMVLSRRMQAGKA
jgi:hypothetical protein